MAPTFHRLQPGEEASLPPGREILTPEALALAELYLIQADLELALRDIQVLERMYPTALESDDALTIAEALYRDAVIQFVGCFGSKFPKLDKGEVYRNVAGGMEAMGYLQDVRDTYAAHNFGPQRQCFIVVIAEPGARSFGVTHFKFKLSLPGADTLGDYQRFIQIALSATVEKVDSQYRIVRDQLGAMGLDGVLKLPVLEVRRPKNHEMRSSRKTFRSGAQSPRSGRRGSKTKRP